METIEDLKKEIRNLMGVYDRIAMRIESGENVKSVEKDFHKAEHRYVFLFNTAFQSQSAAMLALRTNVDEKRNYAKQALLEKGGKSLSKKEEEKVWKDGLYGGRHKPSESCSMR